MIGEGYLKFNCQRSDEDIFIAANTYNELSVWRQKMVDRGLIGINSDGIGYGNISVRAPEGGFYISGTATGGLPELMKNHYARVESWSPASNSLTCKGRINASAESLSHAAIYETLPHSEGAVIHVHHHGMWKKYINKLPATSSAILYGTPEMAFEIRSILLALKPEQDAILVMGGHEDGIIAWGKTLAGAGACILKYYEYFLKQY